jgi:nicotinamidase-related amidase
MSKNALVVIDVQKYYINEHTRDLPQKIADYIPSHPYDFVLFSKFVNHRGSNMYKTFRWEKMMTPDQTDICDNLLQFVNGQNLFQKDTYSLFKAKGFLEFLETNHITDLTLCGLDADACILATAYEGFDLGYTIHVLDDLVGCHVGNSYRDFGLNIIKKNIQAGEI